MDSFHSSSGSEQSKKESVFSNKDNCVVLIDASCQANIAYEVITYDSDDEMVKSRRGIPFGGLRNKKGHPIYSREDIREQYCITRKELDVLEHSFRDSSAARLFGCLSTSHLPDSHCNKSSFLMLSCVNKRKNSSENSSDQSEQDKRFQHSNSQNTSNVSEEEDSDGGFKQHCVKPYLKQQSSEQQRFNHFSHELKDNNRSEYKDTISAQQYDLNRSRARAKVKLHQSYSSGSQDINRSSIRANIYTSKESSTSHSVDELVDFPSGQHWSSQRNARISELSYEMSAKKHVSFDSGDSKVRRSLTCSSGIGGIPHMNASNLQHSTRQQQHSQRNVSPPSISLTSTSSSRREMSPPVASQERLLGTKSSQIEANLKQPSVSPSLSYTPSVSTPCRLIRRVIMKTQATQTEITGLVKSRSSRSIPAYLTLSPRANNQHIVQRRSFDLRVPTTPVSLCEYHQKLILRQTNSWTDSDSGCGALPLIKSRSAHGIMINDTNFDYNDDEVMQVYISGKDYNQMKTSKSDHKLKAIHSICDNNIDEPFLQPLKPTIKSYSNDEVFMPKKDIPDEDNILGGRLIRRHSAKADLAADPLSAVPIASPPPGFGDIEVSIDPNDDLFAETDSNINELSPKKSNSESSHAVITDEGSDLISSTTTDMDDLQSSTNNSKVTTSSPTVVSELNADVPFELSDVNKVDSPILRLKKQMMEALMSPDSESSSFHITSSASSSEVKDSQPIDKQNETSDQTVVKEYKFEPKAESISAEELHTSPIISTSPRDLSSSRTLQRKSDPTIEEKAILEDNESMKIRSLSVPSLKRPTSLPSKRQLLRADETYDERRSSSSSDASSVPRSPHSPESIASTHFSTNVEEMDSDLLDLTPIQEILSSDPSTTMEPTTVIESDFPTKPKVPPKPSFLCALDLNKTELISSKDIDSESEAMDVTEKESFSEDTKSSTEENLEDFKNIITQKLLDIKSKIMDSEPLVTHPEEDEDIIDEEDAVSDEPSGGPLPIRRSLSGELSTVSEVSEEISFNGVYPQKSLSSMEREYIESVDKESAAPMLTLSADPLSSDNIAIHSGATSPSGADSTTSGSFMIDVSMTEPLDATTSAAESDRVTIGKAGSLPCIPTQGVPSIAKVASEGGVGGVGAKRIAKTAETTAMTDLGQNGSTINNRRYEPIVGQLIDLTTESSQATERDIEKSEFSLQHQSSQDIDEESLSLDALNQSLSQKEGTEEQKLIEETEPKEDEEDSQELALIQELSTASESTTTQQISDLKKAGASEEEILSNKEKLDKKPKKRIKTIAHQRNSSSESHTLLSQEEFYIMQRRARSLSRSPDKAFNRESPVGSHHQSCSHHHFTCSECGEAANQHTVPSILRRSRLERTGIPYLYRKSMTIDDIYFDSDDEEEDAGVHTDTYRSALWLYIGRKEEMSVWGHRNPLNANEDRSLPRSESDESTLSEKGFRKHYEAITHRLIHRKASIEMYKRILNRTFVIEKVLTLIRNNGEFGFRIHGSRPVVVSAIEKGTPAEINGLEVGDIVVTVNDTNVLEASHSEVVKLAHTGSDTLKLEVICTSKPMKKNQPPVEHDILMNGYLSRLTDKLVDRQRDDTQIQGSNKLWRRRWFVLKSDFCLYWYKNPKCTEPVGAISLHGYCAGVSHEILFGQSFVFRLVRYATPQKYFAASDIETAGQWVNALNHSATRINQIDPYIDTTLHNIHKNPLSLKYLDCYGYLAKFSRKRKVWRHRYFVLKDACLYFYSDANSNTALGVFYLHGYKVQTCAMIGKKHTFEVIPPEPKFRHIWLLSDSDADRKRWLAALEYSIDRWIRLK